MAPSSSTDDLLNPGKRYKHPGCEELINYRDHVLRHEFDAAATQRKLYAEEKARTLADADSMLHLMDKEWWGGKTRAEIAIEVKYASDVISATLKNIFPHEAESPWLEFVEDVGLTVSIVRSWVENGAQKAVEDANKEFLWKLRESRDQSLAFVHAAADRAENMEGLAKSEEEIQNQVGRMVQSARTWHAKEVDAKSRSEYVERMAQKITDYCSVQPDDTIPKP